MREQERESRLCASEFATATRRGREGSYISGEMRSEEGFAATQARAERSALVRPVRVHGVQPLHARIDNRITRAAHYFDECLLTTLISCRLVGENSC